MWLFSFLINVDVLKCWVWLFSFLVNLRFLCSAPSTTSIVWYPRLSMHVYMRLHKDDGKRAVKNYPVDVSTFSGGLQLMCQLFFVQLQTRRMIERIFHWNRYCISSIHLLLALFSSSSNKAASGKTGECHTNLHPHRGGYWLCRVQPCCHVVGW